MHILAQSYPAQRQQLSREALQLIIDDVAVIPIHQEPQIMDVLDTVADFKQRMLEDVELRLVTMKK